MREDIRFIYINGYLLPTDECCLAMVGIHHPNIYGRQVTEEIAADLAREARLKYRVAVE